MILFGMIMIIQLVYDVIKWQKLSCFHAMFNQIVINQNLKFIINTYVSKWLNT